MRFEKFIDFRSWMHHAVARIDVFINWTCLSTVLWITQKENIVWSLRCWSILIFKCTAAFNLLKMLCQTLHLLQMRTFFLGRKNVSKYVCWKSSINIITLYSNEKKNMKKKYKFLLGAINTEVWFLPCPLTPPPVRWSIMSATVCCIHWWLIFFKIFFFK